VHQQFSEVVDRTEEGRDTEVVGAGLAFGEGEVGGRVDAGEVEEGGAVVVGEFGFGLCVGMKVEVERVERVSTLSLAAAEQQGRDRK
jgi:hypothetical protein